MSESGNERRTAWYGWYLLLVAGMGGLLYGVDIGVISAALLYLGKTIDLTVAKTSVIVAAVLGGSMISSLIAGFFADWFGRKKMMIFSGLLFVLSILLIVSSHGFTLLFIGRLLQGLSGGVIAVVIPLYLAECLSAGKRGRGTAIFQFLITFGVVVSSVVGWLYIQHAVAATAAAHGNTLLIRAAEDHAWRGMFLSVIYPGVCFFIGAFFLSESPRWLFHKGRIEEAYRVCRRSLPEDEVRAEMAQMQELAAASKLRAETFGQGSLLQRKYVLPFVLACIVLAFTQASGINSILSYLVIILKQAGMSPAHAGQGDVLVKLLHCVITVVAIPLVDRRGRKFLLTLGTGGMILSLLAIAFLFRGIEAHHSDVRAQVESAISGNRLTISAASLRTWSNSVQGPVALTVLYSYGGGNKGASIASSESEALTLEPDARHKSAPLVIHQAVLGPVPAENMAWLAAFCLAVFVACHSIGPGVVVWLTLSELMPTRIRSVGMGIALVLNQGVSTLIAGVFLSVVSRYGYHVMFACCAACTVIYFITAAFYLPETKGKSLEEIERSFERP